MKKSNNGYDKFFKSVQKTKTNMNTNTKQKNDAEMESLLREAFPMKQKANPRQFKIPFVAIFLCVIGVAGGVVGMNYPVEAGRWLNAIELTAFGLATAAEEAATGKSKGDLTGDSAGGEVGPDGKPISAKTSECTEVKGFTEEEMSHFNKLNDRKKELDGREGELNALEDELHKQRSELETRISALEKIRADVGKVLEARVEIDQERVNRLVEFYSNMKPKQAADIIATLNEDLAVEVLGKMKKKNAADIMNLLEPAKARLLSEKFTGYARR
jgi:flagellar motility protein MotE (MotC chaperone)